MAHQSIGFGQNVVNRCSAIVVFHKTLRAVAQYYGSSLQWNEPSGKLPRVVGVYAKKFRKRAPPEFPAITGPESLLEFCRGVQAGKWPGVSPGVPFRNFLAHETFVDSRPGILAESTFLKFSLA